MTLLSAFGGGLWIIPLLMLAGIVIWVINGIKSSKSGSERLDRNGAGWVDTPGNIPFVKTWQFKFAAGLAVVLIIFIIWMYNER